MREPSLISIYDPVQMILRWTTVSCGGTRGCATFRSPDLLIVRLGNLGAGSYQSATYGAGLGGGVVHFAPRFPRLRDSDVQFLGCVALATQSVLSEARSFLFLPSHPPLMA